MIKLSKKELMNVEGGSNLLSASFLNSISRAITTLVDLGRALGSSIRRTINGKVCPF